MPAAERYFAARRSAGYANERTVEALGPLLGYLRGLGAAPLPPAEPATETGQLLDRYAGLPGLPSGAWRRGRSR